MRRTFPYAVRPLVAALVAILPQTSVLGAALPRPEAGPIVAVTTCADSGSGSLRAAFTSAVDGETIDLKQLPSTCSVITLTTGEMASPPTANTITVSASLSSPVTINGNNNGRIFRHLGNGVLFANNLVLENGSSSGSTGGGCVYTLGSFFTQFVTMSGCSFNATSNGTARGGAVFAQSTVSLFFSSVTGNQVHGSGGLSEAGGVFGQANVTLSYSTVDNNHNICAYGQPCLGGGIYAGSVNISNSTISNNSAGSGAGLYVAGGATISQSTISGNVSSGVAGGILVKSGSSFTASTIAENRADFQIGAGVYLFTNQASVFKGVIVYGNTAEDGLYASDISGTTQATITGSNNLIGATARTVLPMDTIKTNARLGPLQDNGGVTKTHLLGDCSSAIGHGSQGNFTYTWDQRGPPHQRVNGAAIDIGSTEYLGDRIFNNGFEGPVDPERPNLACPI